MREVDVRSSGEKLMATTDQCTQANCVLHDLRKG